MPRTGKSPFLMTIPTFAAGRFSRASRLSKETCRPPSAGLQARLLFPKDQGAPMRGVHALAQVASFALQEAIPAENLRRALNRTLPASIRILEAKTVPGHISRAPLHRGQTTSTASSRKGRDGWRTKREKTGYALRFWPAMFLLILGRWIWRICRRRPGPSSVHTTFSSFAATDPDSSSLARKSDSAVGVDDEEEGRFAEPHSHDLRFGLATTDGRRWRSFGLPCPRQRFSPSHGAQPGGNHARRGPRLSSRCGDSRDDRRSLAGCRRSYRPRPGVFFCTLWSTRRKMSVDLNSGRTPIRSLSQRPCSPPLLP